MYGLMTTLEIPFDVAGNGQEVIRRAMAANGVMLGRK